MKLPLKILLNLAVVLTGVLSGCCTTANRQTGLTANGSEWLPSVDVPVVLEPAVLDLIPIPGIKAAAHIWIRYLDLDNDGKEDSVVSVASLPEMGPYWRNYRWVTYVFRGTHKGVFSSYGATEATLWFSVVTREAQDHVRYGDTETRRIFRIVQENGQWMAEIQQFAYGNSGGEAGERLMSPKSQDFRKIAISKMKTTPYEFAP
jgi:hypothetical protein